MSATATPASSSRSGRWTSHTEYPLAAIAVLFLGAYAWPILQPGLSHSLVRWCTVVVYVSWAMFAADYATRFALAQNKRSFVWHNLLDLASIALPVLRPLRLLRLVALIRVLNRKTTTSLHGRVAIYVAATVALIVFVASLAVLDAERGKPHANINSFGDALWWAVTTVMTVGYGDRYPVTLAGRLVAVGLMLGGIALLGVVTASIASWLIGRVRDAEASAEARLNRHLEELRAEIAELKALIVDAPRATIPGHDNRGPCDQARSDKAGSRPA
jgi:voltage-gated potassium channel